ncbi:MAG: NAD(P)H-dependent oxidoreductase [Acidimicrobiia bacterium]|nr:NAD(P)H-dependent oxidoreductase [Acidimicrobiia bacterium]
MDESFFFPVILGTARQGRRSEPVARFVIDVLEGLEQKTDLVDVREFDLLATRQSDERIEDYRRMIDKADGLIVVAPEYNHGYPGELKLLLDAGYDEYAHKPLGLVGVSAGGFGGARVVEQLRQVALGLRMIPIAHAVNVSRVKSLIDDNGNLSDEKVAEATEKMVHDMAFVAGAIGPARRNRENR